MKQAGFRHRLQCTDRELLVNLQATVAELKTAACVLFRMGEELGRVEICDHYNGKIYASLEGSEKAAKKLEDVQITGPLHILLGERVCLQDDPFSSHAW